MRNGDIRLDRNRESGMQLGDTSDRDKEHDEGAQLVETGEFSHWRGVGRGGEEFENGGEEEKLRGVA